MNRIISPEIDPVVEQLTLSRKGEDGSFLFASGREQEAAPGVRTYGMLPKDSV